MNFFWRFWFSWTLLFTLSTTLLSAGPSFASFRRLNVDKTVLRLSERWLLFEFILSLWHLLLHLRWNGYRHVVWCFNIWLKFWSSVEIDGLIRCFDLLLILGWVVLNTEVACRLVVVSHLILDSYLLINLSLWLARWELGWLWWLRRSHLSIEQFFKLVLWWAFPGLFLYYSHSNLKITKLPKCCLMLLMQSCIFGFQADVLGLMLLCVSRSCSKQFYCIILKIGILVNYINHEVTQHQQILSDLHLQEGAPQDVSTSEVFSKADEDFEHCVCGLVWHDSIFELPIVQQVG